MRLFNFFFVECLFRKGQRYFSRNKFDLALKAYDEAIRINPKNDGVCLHKALALSGAGNYKDAIEAINRAIEFNPKNPVYYLFAGIICLDAGNTEKALKYFDDSAQLDGDYTFPRQFRALALLKDKKIAEAANVLEKEGFPSDNKFKSRFFMIANEIKNEIREEELQIIKKFMDKYIYKRTCWSNKRDTCFEKKILREEYKKAVLLGELGAFEKSVEVCNRILSKNPDNLDVIKLLAETYFCMERYSDSELFFKKMKEKIDKDVESLFQLGTAQYRQSKFKEAIGSMSRAFDLAGSADKYEIAYWLGKSYLESNERSRALHYLAISFENTEDSFFEKKPLDL